MHSEIAISTESPKVFFNDGRLVTTSQAIADYFDKQHKHVLAKIDALDCSPEFSSANFSADVQTVEVGNGAERESRCYLITKDGFMFLVMGFTGKKAARLKEAYIAKFNAMEAELQCRTTPPHPSEVPAFCDDYANRTEVIHYHDFKPVFCRTLREGEVIMDYESVEKWLKKRGLILLTREELQNLSVRQLALMAG